MPFERVDKSIPRREGSYIHIGSKGRIGIWSSLREKYLNLPMVEVFIDVERKLLGLKPSVDKGFHLSDGSISCRRLLKYNIKKGNYPAKWSSKHQMLIARIEMG